MGLSAAKRERLREIAQEVKEIVGGCLHPDGRPMTFAELEEECIEAGDLLTEAMLEQRVAERERPAEPACCPTCDRPGGPGPDEPRVLQTDRGEVTWMEPSYYCRHCRRSFFPSLGGIGVGGGRSGQPTRTGEDGLCRGFVGELRPGQ